MIFLPTKLRFVHEDSSAPRCIDRFARDSIVLSSTSVVWLDACSPPVLLQRKHNG